MQSNDEREATEEDSPAAPCMTVEVVSIELRA